VHQEIFENEKGWELNTLLRLGNLKCEAVLAGIRTVLIQRLGCLVSSVWWNQDFYITLTTFLTSNLNAGQHPTKPLHWFVHRKTLFWLIRPGILHWFIRPGFLHWFCWLEMLLWFLRCSLLFTSKMLQGDISRRHCVSYVHPFPWCTSLRSTVIQEYHLSCMVSDSLACVFHAFWIHFLAISGTFWIYRTVSTSLDFCWRSHCNVRLLAEDQVRRFHFFKSTKDILRWHFCRCQATLCDDIAFDLFTNLQTVYTTTRLTFAFFKIFSCSY